MYGSRTARHNPNRLRYGLFILEMLALSAVAHQVLAAGPVGFDMAPAAVARPLADPTLPVTPGYEAVAVQLRISTLLDPSAQSTKSAPIQQLLYRVRSHTGHALVLDYDPKTELSSNVEGPIEIALCDERTDHAGLKVSGSYEVVKGELGADSGRKSSESSKYRRLAQQDAVVTSGTIDQARGVYFKLFPAFNRTLEGDKVFTLILQLPIGWQTEILEASLQAWAPASHAGTSMFGNTNQPSSSSTFVVSVWREGNDNARQQALRLAETEEAMREAAQRFQSRIEERSLPTVFHKIGAALDVVDPRIDANWFQRSLVSRVDALHDPSLNRLPVDVRVAILNYQEARNALLEGTADVTAVASR